jgi:glycosyltransferase involved in cell wall biosynthesis
MTEIKTHVKRTNTLNIGLMGILSIHKGEEIIKSMLRLINERNLKVKFILLGTTQNPINDMNFIETGRYRQETIVDLTIKHDIDVFFISSIWPETFSYTTEEVIKMNMPIVAFDLGAPAERIKKYNKGLIINNMDPEYALDSIVNFSNNKLKVNLDVKSRKVLFVIEIVSFATRYRVEHLMDQLRVHGVDTQQVLMKDIDKYSSNDYDAVVIYRCPFSRALSQFISSVKSQNKRAYYDVDDYVFDYDAVKHMPFLKGEDYKDFENYCNNIDKSIRLCDGLITSTETLGKVLKDRYPEKTLYINRNTASAEMVCLSNISKDIIKKDSEKIILGYFSGSKTHDDDFKLISDVILKVLEKNENVYLKIGGVLNLDKKFDKFNNRIYRFDFMDWRKLPSLIATVDINLMPLEDTLFHRCKSENKWMEAALVNVPTVASYNEELELVIKDKINGFLCKTQDEWEKVLNILINDKNLRESIALNANQKVIENYISIRKDRSSTEYILT